MKRLTLILLVGFLFILFGVENPIEAKIGVRVDRSFSVSESIEMEVLETETLVNNYSDKFLPGGTSRYYQFVISNNNEQERAEIADQIYQSMRVILNGQEISYKRFFQDNNYGIEYQLRERLNPGETQQVRISYTHPELAEKVGGLVDAYIPAFSEDFSFSSDQISYTYSTRLQILRSLGAENIVSVEPISKVTEGLYDVYTFNQSDLIGNFVWVQRGSQQVYEFVIEQDLKATQQRNNGNLNEYQMIIPRDINEVNINQKVYFSEISPEPIAINKDEEGNLIGVFRVPAHEDSIIKISGYAILTRNSEDSFIDSSFPGGDISMITKLENYEKYIQTAEYWEVGRKEIKDKADSIAISEDDIYQITSQIYSEIVNEIDYSEVKRFGLNERQGALATLRGGSAVCMEYSDLFITLSRQKNIPARASFGYGYDSRLSREEQEPHQWAQVYLPEYDNWVSIDVTWGETGNQVIGGDLNHFYTHLAAIDPNTPSVLSRLTLSNDYSELLPPRYNIQVQSELEDDLKVSLNTTSDILKLYPPIDTDNRVHFFSQTLENRLIYLKNNIFSNPGSIDNQGWFLVSIIILVILISGFIIIKLFRFIFVVIPNKVRPHPIVD